MSEINLKAQARTRSRGSSEETLCDVRLERDTKGGWKMRIMETPACWCVRALLGYGEFEVGELVQHQGAGPVGEVVRLDESVCRACRYLVRFNGAEIWIPEEDLTCAKTAHPSPAFDQPEPDDEDDHPTCEECCEEQGNGWPT